MQNIIIKKEWLRILSDKSRELRTEVMSAIFDYAISGSDPEGLSPAAETPYQLIKVEMLSLEAELDFDGAREAAIRKKRAKERREARKAEKTRLQKDKEEIHNAQVICIEKNRTDDFVPLPASGYVADDFYVNYDHYYNFEHFYNLYPGEKEDIHQEYLRYVHQFPRLLHEIDRLPASIRSQIAWHEKMQSQGYLVASFPTLREWITDQCWRDRLPEI